jgi:hypothetical protein
MQSCKPPRGTESVTLTAVNAQSSVPVVITARRYYRMIAGYGSCGARDVQAEAGAPIGRARGGGNGVAASERRSARIQVLMGW